MKFPKLSFAQIGKKLQTAVKRFPLTVIAIVTLTGFLFVQIHSNKNDYVDQRVWFFLPVAIIASLSFYLFAENRIRCILRNVLNGLIICLLAWYAFTLQKPMVESDMLRFVILGVSFALALFFAPYVTGKNQLKFWDYVQETFFQLAMAFFFGGVFMAGLSLALVSLDQLFSVNIPDEYYGYLATTCFVIFSPLYFLSSVSKENPEEEVSDIDISRFLKILGLYILLPILGIYIIILYGYLGKIIATWQLPNGWVSWLVSVLGIAGYLTMFILHPLYLKRENKVVNFFTRFFPLLLLPLLTLMFIGIMRRFSDYGITINRLLVLILNLWLFGISIYLFITQSKQTKWIFISFALVTFLSVVGPWNVMKITKKSLSHELKQLLTETKWYGMHKDDDVKKYLVPLNTSKQERLHDIIIYLSTKYGIESIRPFYVNKLGEKATDMDFLDSLGINDEFDDNKYFSLNSHNKNIAIDIKNYHQLIQLSRISSKNKCEINDTLSAQILNDTLKIKNTKNNQEQVIPLDKIINKGIEDGISRVNEDDLIVQGTDYKLMVLRIDGQKEKNNMLKINNFDALLFLK